MGDYNSVNEEIKAQAGKLKNQSLPKKIAYFWHYYKWVLIGGIAIAILVISTLQALLTRHLDPYLTGIFLNTRLSYDDREALIDEYAAAAGIDTGKYSLDFDCSLAYNPENPSDSASSYTPMIMLAYSEGNIGDFMLTDAASFNFFAEAGYYRNLNEVFDESLLAQHADRLRYFDLDDGNGSVPVGVDLSDSPKLSLIGYEEDDGVLFSLFFRSDRVEQALAFLEWVYTE